MTKKKAVQTNKNVDNIEENNVDLENQKKKPNILIVILFIILIMVIIFAIVVRIKYNDKDVKIKNNDKDEVMVNEKKNVVKDKEVDNFSFSDVLLLSQNEQTYLTFKVTNNSDKDYEVKEIHIFLKDKDGNDMISYLDEEDNYINYLIGYVDDVIKVGDSKDISTSIDIDISNSTYTIEYEVIK